MLQRGVTIKRMVWKSHSSLINLNNYITCGITGEKRLVLHHLARIIIVDGVNKRDLVVSQQKAADFANKVHAGDITNAAGVF